MKQRNNSSQNENASTRKIDSRRNLLKVSRPLPGKPLGLCKTIQKKNKKLLRYVN